MYICHHESEVKIMKKLSIMFASVAMLFGVGLGVSALHTNDEVSKADAASTMKTFFLDCTSVDGWDSESICIGTWNGTVNTYTEATKKAENYWQVTIDISGLLGVEFYRCSPGNTGTRWNKSSWNSNPSSNNYCQITNWDESSNWSSVTSGVDETYEVASTSPSTATKRIWVDPKNNFYDANARAALRVFNGDVHYKTYILGGSSQYVNMTHEGDTQYFFYVDIPVSYDCQLVRLHNAFNFVWTYSANFSTVTGYNPTLIMFSWDAAASLSPGGLDNNNNYTVEYAERVLDGYSTCLDSPINGYGAYPNINTNILSKLSSAKLTQLRSATFSAPGFGTRTYGDKIDLMSNSGSSLSNIRFVVLDPSSTSTTLTVIIITVIALGSVGGFFLIKRKKKLD